jgi:hypothetical protein
VVTAVHARDAVSSTVFTMTRRATASSLASIVAATSRSPAHMRDAGTADFGFELDQQSVLAA